MKIAIWFLFVILDLFVLITSILYHNIYLTIFSFVLALLLNKFKSIVPMPKKFENLNTIHKMKK